MKFYHRKRRSPAVIMVALIDIFAILLIFVIATSTFKRIQPAVTIRLPESSSGEIAPGEGAPPAVIAVSKEGVIYVDGAETAPEALVPRIKEAMADRKLALEADTLAPFGIVIRVMDALKAAGVSGSLPAFTETRTNEN